jgi:hypothetical protein
MLGVQEPALEAPLEHVEDGLPVDAGRLHAHQRHPEAVQPVGERLELPDRGAEAARLLLALAPALALARHPHRGNDAVAVHIKPRAALNDDVHHLPPFQTTGRAGSEGPPFTTLRFALEAAVNGSAGPARHTYQRAHSTKEMPASTDPAPAFSPRHGGARSRRHGYLPCAPIGNWSQPVATVFARFGRFSARAFATGCHRLRPLGSIEAP